MPTTLLGCMYVNSLFLETQPYRHDINSWKIYARSNSSVPTKKSLVLSSPGIIQFWQFECAYDIVNNTIILYGVRILYLPPPHPLPRIFRLCYGPACKYVHSYCVPMLCIKIRRQRVTRPKLRDYAIVGGEGAERALAPFPIWGFRKENRKRKRQSITTSGLTNTGPPECMRS